MGKNRTDTSTQTGQVATQPADTSAQQPATDQQSPQAPAGTALDPSTGDDGVNNPIIVNR